MTGGITGMLRICKKGRYGWIGLAGPQFEVCVLRIPTGQRGVVLRDRLVGIRSCCAWRVGVQVILEDLEIDLLEPRLEKARLPEPGQMVGSIGVVQILYRRVLLIGIVRSENGRRR